jgi:hypothetical protein
MLASSLVNKFHSLVSVSRAALRVLLLVGLRLARPGLWLVSV